MRPNFKNDEYYQKNKKTSSKMINNTGKIEIEIEIICPPEDSLFLKFDILKTFEDLRENIGEFFISDNIKSNNYNFLSDGILIADEYKSFKNYGIRNRNQIFIDFNIDIFFIYKGLYYVVRKNCFAKVLSLINDVAKIVNRGCEEIMIKKSGIEIDKMHRIYLYLEVYNYFLIFNFLNKIQ